MTGNCPICRKTSITRYRPFCSKRCADLDLGGWLDGKYRIETDEEAEIEDFRYGIPEDEE